MAMRKAACKPSWVAPRETCRRLPSSRMAVRPDAIDDGPLLGDAVLLGAGHRPGSWRPPCRLTVLPLRPWAASRARSAASASLVALDGLGAQPVGPRPALVLVVDVLAILEVLLVDLLDSRLSASCWSRHTAASCSSRPAPVSLIAARFKRPAALRGLDQSVLPVAGLRPLDGARRLDGSAARPGIWRRARPCRRASASAGAGTGAPAARPGGLALGGWLERPKAGLRACSWTDRGRSELALTIVPASVGDDQTVAALAQLQAVRAHDLVQLGPGLRRLDWLQAFALDPAEQAFDARVPLHVVGPVLGASLARLVVVALQAVFASPAGRTPRASVLWSLYGSCMV